MAEEILRGNIKSGDTANVSAENGKLTFVAATPFNVRSAASMPSTASLNTTSTSVKARTTVPGTGVCRAMVGGVISWAGRIAAVVRRASNKQLVRIKMQEKCRLRWVR